MEQKFIFRVFSQKKPLLKIKDENFLKEIQESKSMKEICRNSFRVFFVQKIYHQHMNELLKKSGKDIEENKGRH